METDLKSVLVDLEAMQDALTALVRIPTAARRELAFRWLRERVQADVERLRQDEHIERTVQLVGHILGEND